MSNSATAPGTCAGVCVGSRTRCCCGAGSWGFRCTRVRRSPRSATRGDASPGSGSLTAARCPLTSSCAMPTPPCSTSTCSPAGRPSGHVESCGAHPARSRASCSCSRWRAGCPARRTASGSPPTRTPSSMRSSDPRRPPWRTRPSTCTPPTTRRCAPTTGRKAGSCWSTRHHTTRRAPESTGTPRVCESVTPTTSSACSPLAATTSATGSGGARSARPPILSATPQHPAARSTVRRRTVHAPRCADPPTGPGSRGLYLVGGSAHPGGGLPLVLLSAKIVATLIGPARTGVARSAPPPR